VDASVRGARASTNDIHSIATIFSSTHELLTKFFSTNAREYGAFKIRTRPHPVGVSRSTQQSLFPPAATLPADGLHYREGFITPDEEQALLARIATLPFENAKYQQYTARRRIVSFGYAYDYSRHERLPAAPLPQWLTPFVERAAELIGVGAEEFSQALIAEYAPGTPLGWHRDVPDYEHVVGLSLLAPGRLRFRRYPWRPAERDQIFSLEPAPRSAYALTGDARWRWQHSVPPATERRISITLRTLRARSRSG
jgi:alkylated DNA repair dioxygenase AlkB